MKIISFYSFKGGVGRSLSLINVAYQLSQRKGQRVGLIDLDIEASGLNQILNIPVENDSDLLSLLLPENRDVSKLEQYVFDVPFSSGGQPRVFLLPTIADSVNLDRITWNVATQHFLSDELFPAFERLYKLDYLLVDCRSGLSEAATFALQVADLEMLVCRLDKQNQYGIERIVEVCKAAAKPFKIIASACPEKDTRKYIRKFDQRIKSSVNYVLPYDYRLYYEEFIISRRYPYHRLSKVYLSIAEDIHKEA